MYRVYAITFYLVSLWILNDEMKDPYIFNVSLVYVALLASRLLGKSFTDH